MPLAPALKGLLLASSLIAAGVAAYETDPNVREFVDRTTKRAEDAIVDFLENLEREFAPDGVGRGQIRRRREMLRRERERETMRMGREGERSERARERETGRGGDVVVASNGGEMRLRQRQRIEIVDAEAQGENGRDDVGVASMQRHETLFEHFPASLSSSTIHNIPIDDATTSTPHSNDNNDKNNSTSLLDANDDDDEEDISTASLDNLSDLDPFADPPIESLTPLVLSTAHLSPSPTHQQRDRTSVTPTSSNSPQILTPVTPRTVAEDEVSDSYFSDFSAGSLVLGEGGERRDAEVGGDDRRRSLSVSVASSGVGFETPDEDEDDVDWGRA